MWYCTLPFFACASVGSALKFPTHNCFYPNAKCHLQRWFKQSNYNLSSLCLGCIRIFILMWLSIVWLQSDHFKTHLNRKCKEGLRGGRSTLDNKVKMITVAAAANKSHIITKQADRVGEALRRFGLFVRLKYLFLFLSHVTQIVFFLCWLWCLFQLELEYSEWSNHA